MPRAFTLKTIGYVISSVSVVLLGVVAWKSAEYEPLLAACLIGGMAASLLGMFLRWLSYCSDKKNGDT